MKFAEIRECSKKRLLEELRNKELQEIQNQIDKLERDLETRRKEQDALKDEMIRVIQGKSTLDRDMLADLVAENRDATVQIHDALQAAKAEQEQLRLSAEKMRRDCNDLFTWANVYDEADFEQKQAILHQFIKEVRVGRDYDIDITLNISLEEFEEFRAHSMAKSLSKNAQENPKRAPKTVAGGSNASIVIIDEIENESLSILPKTSAHAKIAYAERESEI